MADIQTFIVAPRAPELAICALWRANALDRIMSFFASDCVLEMPRAPHPWGTRCAGSAAVREGFAHAWSASQMFGTPTTRIS
jgi:ketosteroid isomerase-like protein